MTSTHITDRSVQLAAEVYARSGLALTVRPADASDKLLLEDFFKHVSADDLRFRFLTTIRRVDDARMDDLCVVDIPRKITFLALRGNLVVAIGTVAGDPDTRKAARTWSLPAKYIASTHHRQARQPPSRRIAVRGDRACSRRLPGRADYAAAGAVFAIALAVAERLSTMRLAQVLRACSSTW